MSKKIFYLVLSLLLSLSITKPVLAVTPEKCNSSSIQKYKISDISYEPSVVYIKGSVTITIQYDPEKVTAGKEFQVWIWPDGLGKTPNTQTVKVPDDKKSPLRIEFNKISDISYSHGHWVEVSAVGESGSCKTPDSTIRTQRPPIGIDTASCTISTSSAKYNKGSAIDLNFTTSQFEYENGGCAAPPCADRSGYALFLFEDNDGSIRNAIQDGSFNQKLEIISSDQARWKPTNKYARKYWSFPNQSTTRDLSSNLNSLNLDIGDYLLAARASDYPGLYKTCPASQLSIVSPDTQITPAPPPIIIPDQPIPGKVCTEQDIKDDTCSSGGGESCEDKKDGRGPAMKTAIGCIHTNPQELVKDFMTFIIAISGGLAFLMMLLGAFGMLTSAGNPEALNAGKERLTSAIIGLLFVIFAILLMQIIGFDILKLPEFGR